MSEEESGGSSKKTSSIRNMVEFLKNPSYHINKHDERAIALLVGFLFFAVVLFFGDFLPNNGYTFLLKALLLIAATYFGLKTIDKYNLNEKSLQSLEEEEKRMKEQNND